MSAPVELTEAIESSASSPTISTAVIPTKETPYHKVIVPRSGWRAINLAEIWNYRELLFFLTWRDVKVRYKQTVLGAAWAIIQPVMTMIVFSIFFGRLGGLAKTVDGAYPVFVYTALLPWTFFSSSVSQASGSLVANSGLVRKIFFPRLIIPTASTGSGLVDFSISFCVMMVLMVYFGVPFTAGLLVIPVFVLMTILTAVGAGVLLAALVVSYRDVRYVVGFLLQLWMFASPVAYPMSVVPERWQLLYAANPMVSSISGFRWAIQGEPFRWDCMLVSILSMVIMLTVGMFYFRRVERRFADII